jgi:hypothetical protein
MINSSLFDPHARAQLHQTFEVSLIYPLVEPQSHHHGFEGIHPVKEIG